jgi:hypothetical protein
MWNGLNQLRTVSAGGMPQKVMNVRVLENRKTSWVAVQLSVSGALFAKHVVLKNIKNR